MGCYVQSCSSSATCRGCEEPAQGAPSFTFIGGRRGWGGRVWGWLPRLFVQRRRGKRLTARGCQAPQLGPRPGLEAGARAAGGQGYGHVKNSSRQPSVLPLRQRAMHQRSGAAGTAAAAGAVPASLPPPPGTQRERNRPGPAAGSAGRAPLTPQSPRGARRARRA